MTFGDIFIYSLLFLLTVGLVVSILMRHKTVGTLVVNMDDDGSYILSLELDEEIPKVASKYYANFNVVTRHWAPRE